MDEISQAISDSVADLPMDGGTDTSVDTSTELSTSDNTASTDNTQPEAQPLAVDGQPVQRPMSRSQQRIQQLANERRHLEETHAAEKKTWNEEREQYEWVRADPNAKALYDGLRLMENEPKRFVENVLLKDERYAGLIALKEAAQDAAALPQQGALPEPQFPAPDLEDGYSPDAIAKYVRDVASFAAQQAQTSVGTELKALRELVSPILKERADAQIETKAVSQQTQAWDRITKVYGPDAADHKGAMHEWCKKQWAKGINAGMQDAVEAVLVPALLKEREELRAGKISAADDTHRRGIAENNTRAAAADRPTSQAVASESGDPIENAIRDATRGLFR